jgi:hypothetical protein
VNKKGGKQDAGQQRVRGKLLSFAGKEAASAITALMLLFTVS